MSDHRTSLMLAGTIALTLLGVSGARGNNAQPNSSNEGPPARLADGHPDLSGSWMPEGGGDPNQPNPDQIAEKPTDLPPYKPQYLAKVEKVHGRLGYTDPNWQCAPPGIPRVDAPYMIVQRPGMVVFIYTDYSTVYVGQVPRVLYTDGRPPFHGDPSFYGESTAHWEGDTLVVESQNFVSSTWMGARGEIHSDQMRVVERLTAKSKNRLHYEETIYDPVMLTAPWSKQPYDLVPTNVPLIESPPCVARTNDPDAILEQNAIDAKSKADAHSKKPEHPKR